MTTKLLDSFQRGEVILDSWSIGHIGDWCLALFQDLWVSEWHGIYDIDFHFRFSIFDFTFSSESHLLSLVFSSVIFLYLFKDAWIAWVSYVIYNDLFGDNLYLIKHIFFDIHLMKEKKSVFSWLPFACLSRCHHVISCICSKMHDAKLPSIPLFQLLGRQIIKLSSVKWHSLSKL